MTVYTVSTSGVDITNPGSELSPWRTFSYALGPDSPVVAGDTVQGRTGNYDELVRVQKSGTGSGAKITVKAKDGETVVFRGANGSQKILEIINRKWLSFEDGLEFRYNWSAPGGVTRFPWILAQGDLCTDITFKNIKIERTGWSNLTTLSASTWQEWGMVIDDASRITIDGLWLRGLNQGIQFKGTGVDCILKYSDIQYTKASNVTVASSEGVLRRLLIAFNKFGFSANEDGIQGMPFFLANGTVDPNDDSNRGVIVLFNEFQQAWENAIDRKGCSKWILHGNVFRDTRGSNDGISSLNRSSFNTIGRGHSNEGNPHDMLDRYNILYSNAAGWWVIPGSKIYNNVLINNNTDFNGPDSSYANIYAINQERRIDLYKTCILNNIISGPHNGAAIALYMDLGGANHQLDLAGNLYAGESFRNNATGANYGSFSAYKSALAAMGGIRRAEENSAYLNNHAAIGYKNAPVTITGAPDTYDFELQSTSPGYGAGQYHTKTTGSGTATQYVTVEDCGVFTDWFGLTDSLLPVETCFIGGAIHQSFTVLEVDYANNRIKIGAAITYTAGIPIWHGSTSSPNAGSGGWQAANPNPPPPPPPSGGTGKRIRASFVLNTSTGNQDVPLPSGLSNAPKLWRFLWTRCTASGTPVAGESGGVGFAWDNGGTLVQAAYSWRGKDASNPTATSRRSATDSCIYIQDPTNGGIDALATVVLANSNASNLRINITDAPAGSYLVLVEAIDCLNGILAPFDIPQSLNATSTPIALSGWSAAPQLVYVVSNHKGPHPTNSSHLRGSFGMAVVIGGTITQQCLIVSQENGQTPSKSAAYISSNYIAGECDANGALQRALELTTASSSQIIFTVRVGAYPDATADGHCLALNFDGLSVWMSILTTPTAATNPWEGIAPGFDAGDVEILAATVQTNNLATLGNDGGAFGWGWWDRYSGNQGSIAFASEHGQAASNTQSSTHTSKIIDLAQADGSDGLQMNITGTSGGTLVQGNFTKALGASRKLLVLAVQAEAAASMVAGISPSATTVEVGQNVTFTNTTAASGTTVTGYVWDFDDGATSTATNPVHNWAAAGVYTVELTATDGTISDTETVVITVTAAPPPPVIPTEASEGVLGGGNADLGIYSQVLGAGYTS